MVFAEHQLCTSLCTWDLCFVGGTCTLLKAGGRKQLAKAGRASTSESHSRGPKGLHDPHRGEQEESKKDKAEV